MSINKQLRRVVLQSLEWCPGCGKVYLSTFEIRNCDDHEDEAPIMEPGDMENHLYADKEGIHLCEGQRMIDNNPDTYLVWTKCGKDVPANKSFKSKEEITCWKCKEIIFSEAQPIVAEIRELKARIEELESRCRYKESLIVDCLKLIGRQKTTIDDYAKVIDDTIKGIKEALTQKT